MRIFIAIDLSKHIRERLRAIQHGITVAWIRPERMHLTLRFIGDASARQCQELLRTLRTLTVPAFDLHVRGVGTFPSTDAMRPPTVLWAGVEASQALHDLQHAVEMTVQHVGIAPEPRPFHAHITLARLDHDPGRSLTTWLDAWASYDAGTCRVDAVHCYESVQETDRSSYHRLY